MVQYKNRIDHERKRPVRNKVVKVTMFDSEYLLLESKNPYNSVAKLLRESALNMVRATEEDEEPEKGKGKRKNKTPKLGTYTKLDREFVLELSRIGNNINQLARAVNTDLAARQPLDAVKLLHVLISIDETLKALRESVQ
jgi:hypothetical protein